MPPVATYLQELGKSVCRRASCFAVKVKSKNILPRSSCLITHNAAIRHCRPLELIISTRRPPRSVQRAEVRCDGKADIVVCITFRHTRTLFGQIQCVFVAICCHAIREFLVQFSYNCVHHLYRQSALVEHQTTSTHWEVGTKSMKCYLPHGVALRYEYIQFRA